MADDRPQNTESTQNSQTPQPQPTGSGESEGVKARLVRTLGEYAARITSVRNDVYTTKPWQFVINFLLGGGAIALLVASMFTNGGAMAACAICGFVLVIATVVYNYVLRSMSPTSFLQYTYIDKNTGKRYCYQILSKTRATFFDGTDTIECNKDSAALAERPYFPEYRFDFFADMDPTERTTDGEKEVFKGTVESRGKRVPCSIVFKSCEPVYATIAGARIKYFDVNTTKEKFVVPVTLKKAARALKIDFPKIPGLYVKDDVKDYTKQ